MENNLSIRTKIQISKPASEVFEAIINPEKMSNYFIAKGSAKMESGKTVLWSFPEFEGDFPIRVQQVKPVSFVSFYWDNESVETLVEITIDAVGEETVVTVTEKEMENNENGIKWLKGNTEGWANFLACLKAYTEYGINLRKGAFDYMKT
ncbi:SRPBCC domain-containing protein [Pseudopedobacter sp.]|uniref:SRPBCC domain-containing protein n=1 Tax=Pseudopedobacter sp. TaxID=1936787 RepID=UPI0033411AE7